MKQQSAYSVARTTSDDWSVKESYPQQKLQQGKDYLTAKILIASLKNAHKQKNRGSKRKWRSTKSKSQL
jgi:hypothetical protein